MNNNIYDDYKEALEEARRQDDSDALTRIKAELISTYGRQDDDVDTLLRYHG